MANGDPVRGEKMSCGMESEEAMGEDEWPENDDMDGEERGPGSICDAAGVPLWI